MSALSFMLGAATGVRTAVLNYAGKVPDAVENRDMPFRTWSRGSHYLLLQFPSTPFVWALGNELKRRGHGVTRVRMCMGDHLFWPGKAHDYRGTIEGFESEVHDLIRRESVT